MGPWIPHQVRDVRSGQAQNMLKQRNLAVAALLALALGSSVPDTSHAASLKSCVAGLKARAVKSGVPRAVVDMALGDVKFDEKVVRFSRSQPEFRLAIWDYMAFLVDEERLEAGAAMLKQHDKTLRAVEKKYGVDRHILAGLWGVESDFGRKRGTFYIPHGLANVICAGKRPRFFTNELVLSLKLVARGDVKNDDLYGSWAGAFGQNQFLASTYIENAVDFDGDGRRDLVHSVPDALASAAHFLKRAGWRPGTPWGFEVLLPKRYRGTSGRKRRTTLNTWAARGLKRADGQKLQGKGKAGLLLPAGKNGPAFLVYKNFDALFTYNAAESYALAIGHLGDRLKGGKPFVTPYPTDDLGLSRAQRTELQRLLLKAGYDIGTADGKIGPVTVAAIKEAQKKHGLKATGRPSMKIYKALGGE
jgi:lytic murein transglycosylase